VLVLYSPFKSHQCTCSCTFCSCTLFTHRHASHKGHGVPVVVVAPGDLTPEGDGWQCPDLRRLADHVAFVCNSVVGFVVESVLKKKKIRWL
jgi:hypothetical protein